MTEPAMTEHGANDPPAELAEQIGLDTGPGRRRSRLRLFLAVAAALVLLLLVPVFLRGPRPVRWRTEPVRRGTLSVVVSATGTLQPRNQVDVGSELSGVVRSVEATYNQRVSKGQVIARLDTTKLQAQVGQYRAALAAAQAKVSQARATVEEDRLKLDRYEQVREKSGGKMPAPADVDAAVAALARARADLASAEAEVLQARAVLDATTADLTKAVIRSPVDGVVLKRSVEPGQTVAAALSAPVLFTVAEDLRWMELRVDVDEADVGRVKVGQAARFTVDAFPDRTFLAKVAQVRLGATTTSGVVTYTTVLAVTNDDLALFPGMTATAEIEVERADDALLVPSAALRFSPPAATARPGGFLERLVPRPPGRPAAEPSATGPARQVYVVRAGTLTAIPVKTGSSAGQVTAILEGNLEPGSQVVVGEQGGSP